MSPQGGIYSADRLVLGTFLFFAVVQLVFLFLLCCQKISPALISVKKKLVR